MLGRPRPASSNSQCYDAGHWEQDINVRDFLGTLLALSILLSTFDHVGAQGVMEHVDLQSPEMTEAEMSREQLIALLSGDSDQTVDLSSRRLSGLDLRGVDFRGANLRWARLNGADLRGANLSNVILDSAWLLDSNLENANLSGANLFSTQLQGANLRNAVLTGARIVANLERADLTGAILRQANLAADMRNQSMGLMRAILRLATLDKADLSGVKAARADAEFASFRGAILDGADFSGAELAGADLTGASVAGCNLSGADLASARLVSVKGEAVGLDTAKNLSEAILENE